MASNTAARSARDERQWFIVGRFEEFEGEGRANLLRMVGIAVFYAVELVNYHGLNLGFLPMPKVVERPFHLAVTLLVLAWATLCLSVLLCRRNGFFPSWLKYLSTGCDLLLLTSVLTLADGPRSPLTVVYLLIIATAGLRFSLPLVWFATAGAVACYLFLLGLARWGKLPEGWPTSNMELPRHAQVIFLLALVLCGVILGQVIRRVRSVAELYTQRQGGAS